MTADGFLKTAIGVAALAVAWYYAIHLPGQEAAARTAKEEQARIAQDNLEARERQHRASFAKCKEDAVANYSARWDASCATLHDSEAKAQRGCLDSGYTLEYCSTTFHVRPAKDCELPTPIAEKY